MTGTRHEGDRATGAVPPLLLVVGGLLVTLVAVVALVLELRGGGSSAVSAPTTPPVVTSSPTPAPSPSATEEEETTASPTTSATRSPSPSPTSSGTTPAPSPTSAATPEETTQADAAPQWISIPSAGVDQGIVPQGLAADGTINPGRDEVIWFTGSGRVRPGQVGTAVVAGHVTWEGAPDAFADLPSVGVGDVVTVGYTDGTTRSFTVTETAAVDKDQLARSLTVWGPHPDRPRLAIVTCDPVLGYQADGHTAANFLVVAEG